MMASNKVPPPTPGHQVSEGSVLPYLKYVKARGDCASSIDIREGIRRGLWGLFHRVFRMHTLSIPTPSNVHLLPTAPPPLGYLLTSSGLSLPTKREENVRTDIFAAHCPDIHLSLCGKRMA